MRNRVPRYLAERGMSRERYMQLVWVCREYDAMRRKIVAMRDTLRPARYGDLAGGGGARTGDPTALAAVRAADSRESRMVCAIERTARLVAGEDAGQVLDCVCRGRGFEMQSPRPACGERVFRSRVWEFFAALDAFV